MIQEQIKQLLANHKHTTSTLRSISTEIIDLIELGCAGDEEAFDKLKQLNSKEHNSINTFLKVSSLLLKVLPIEHRIAGTELAKYLDHEQLEEPEDMRKITPGDIEAVDDYIQRYKAGMKI